MFASASGQTFGLDAHGHLAGNGTGMIFHQGDTTTYVVPGGTYSSAAITGTGNGAAHVEVFGIIGARLPATPARSTTSRSPPTPERRARCR